jgi:hypothetical protein
LSIQFVKKTLPLALGLSVPVLALAGCPIPGLGTNPSPSPSATTAAATTRTTTVITKIDIPSSGDRTITLKNLGTDAKDLTKWALTYEYTEGSAKMIHARIVSGSSDATVSLAAGSELVISEATASTGAHIKLDSALGGATGVGKLGLQASHGAVGLFKGATAEADLTSGNLVDYVQYGTDKTYTHAQLAVDAKYWESKTAVAPAIALGAKLVATTPGATGSANWTKQ